jgi:hypothetical protein
VYALGRRRVLGFGCNVDKDTDANHVNDNEVSEDGEYKCEQLNDDDIELIKSSSI